MLEFMASMLFITVWYWLLISLYFINKSRVTVSNDNDDDTCTYSTSPSLSPSPSLSLSLPLSLTYPMPDLLYIIIELVQLFVSRFLQLESLLLTLDRLIMCRL